MHSKLLSAVSNDQTSVGFKSELTPQHENPVASGFASSRQDRVTDVEERMALKPLEDIMAKEMEETCVCAVFTKFLVSTWEEVGSPPTYVSTEHKWRQKLVRFSPVVGVLQVKYISTGRFVTDKSSSGNRVVSSSKLSVTD